MGPLHALLVTLLIEVPIAVLAFPRPSRVRIGVAALASNTATNLLLNVGLPWLGVLGMARILIGEALAVVVEAAAYALASRPRDVGRALVVSAVANAASFTLGGALAHVLFA